MVGKIIAACGNDCASCPRYVATQNNKPEELRAVAELWYKCGFRSSVVPNEEIKCHGCSSSSYCRYDILKCSQDRHIQNCGQCHNYPCAKMKVALERTASYEKELKTKLSPEEFQILAKAFWYKMQNLRQS